MTNTKRPYTGFDKVVLVVPPGVEKFMDLLERRWNLTNLGILSIRAKRSAPAEYQDKRFSELKKLPEYKKYMSVHATGRGVDAGWSNRSTAVEAWDWCLAHATELGLEEMNDYAYDRDGKGPGKAWGRGYRCNRAHEASGVKVYSEFDNAGTPNGKWLHFEISPLMSLSAEAMEKAWRAIPRPEIITKN